MKKTGKTKSSAARKPAGKTTAKATSAPVRRPGSENAIIIVSGKPLRRIAAATKARAKTAASPGSNSSIIIGGGKPKQTLRRVASRIR